MATPSSTSARLSSTLTAFLERAERIALCLDPRRVAAVNGIVIALLGVFGILHIVFEPRLGVFDLDGERNASSTYASALWACLALVAALLGHAERGRPARVWNILAGALLLAAFDEFAAIHERLERITGIDWQVLYSPLALLAAILLVLVARRLRELGVGFWLFVAGTTCAAASQVIEAVEYGEGDRRVAAFDTLVVGEELLEVSSALLIGLALLSALRTVCGQARA